MLTASCCCVVFVAGKSIVNRQSRRSEEFRLLEMFTNEEQTYGKITTKEVLRRREEFSEHLSLARPI